MIRDTNKSITLFIIAAILIAPVHSIAQRAEISDNDELIQAKANAEADAERDANKPLWLAGGCLFSVFTVGLAYGIHPLPRTERLIGKSPDYVWAYTQVYKENRRDLQIRYSMIGCGISGVTFAIAMIVNFAKGDIE